MNLYPHDTDQVQLLGPLSRFRRSYASLHMLAPVGDMYSCYLKNVIKIFIDQSAKEYRCYIAEIHDNIHPPR